jgi:hypothetical protein
MDHSEVIKQKSRQLNDNTTPVVTDYEDQIRKPQCHGNANLSPNELYHSSEEVIGFPGHTKSLSWSGIRGSDTTTDEEQGQPSSEEGDPIEDFDESHSSSEDQLCKEFDIEIVFAEESSVDDERLVGSGRELSSSLGLVDGREPLCKGNHGNSNEEEDDSNKYSNMMEKCHHLTTTDDGPSERCTTIVREIRFPHTDMGWCEDDDIDHGDSTRHYRLRMKPNPGLRSILKSQEDLPSISERRRSSVCFSDILGMVRCFGECDPVACVGSTPLRQSRFEWSFPKSRTYRESLELSEKQMIVLHDLSFTHPELRGVVYIRNLTYEKHVYVRYSCDNWGTINEVEATYDYGIYGKLVDQYVFTINLESEFASHDEILILFALRFECHPCGVFWDNNNGENYYARLIYRSQSHKDHIVYDLTDSNETSPPFESNGDGVSDENESEDQQMPTYRKEDGKKTAGSSSSPSLPLPSPSLIDGYTFKAAAVSNVNYPRRVVEVDEKESSWTSWQVLNLARTRENGSMSDLSRRTTASSSNSRDVSMIGSSFLSTTSDSCFAHDWNTPEFIRKWKTSDFLDAAPSDLSLRG